jgi:hypothetical protein
MPGICVVSKEGPLLNAAAVAPENVMELSMWFARRCFLSTAVVEEIYWLVQRRRDDFSGGDVEGARHGGTRVRD